MVAELGLTEGHEFELDLFDLFIAGMVIGC